MTPATARSHRGHARPTVAPRAPRRVSGPVRPRVATAPAGAAIPRRGTTSIFVRVRALPDHRMVDRLLRSRLWIWALGLLLGGIVTMQVSLLKLNSGISRAVETTTTLQRANGELEASIARLSATDRVQQGAATLGMVMPAAGDVDYLTARDGDAARAIGRMQPPSEEARALLANHGIVPGSLAAAPVTTGTTATTTATPTTTTATPTTTTAAPAATTTTTTAAATTTTPATTGTAPAQTTSPAAPVVPQG